MSTKAKVRTIMVLCESMAGSGHKVIRLRPKVNDKLEFLHKDPYIEKVVLYKEKKKVRTISGT